MTLKYIFGLEMGLDTGRRHLFSSKGLSFLKIAISIALQGCNYCEGVQAVKNSFHRC
jgi:hypothetical protein